MESQGLRLLLKEIKSNIDDFKKELVKSEDHYQNSLKLLTDPELSSLLMEQHVIHIEQQKGALDKMEALYSQVQNQLAERYKFD